MESEQESEQETTTGLVTSEPEPNLFNHVINLQDTFVTLQTKEGQSSQQIPLFQFLEQVMGTHNVEEKLQAETISMLLSGQVAATHGGTMVTGEGQNAAPNHSVEETDKSGHGNVKSSNDSVAKIGEGSASGTTCTPPKPKGRGRPRKLKVDVKLEETIHEPKKNRPASDASVRKENKSDNPSSNTIQILRRSSRIPAKNSRFKDDYVESFLPSKAMTSGDTRLMTLALAAECHTTKPNKSSEDTESTDALSSKQNTLNDKEMKTVHVSSAKEEQASVTGQEKKPGIEVLTKLSAQYGSLIQRSLLAQMDILYSNTGNQMVPNAVQSLIEEDKDIHSSCYYVISEPETNPSGNILLIKKLPKGMEFNVADVSNAEQPQSHDAPPAKHPLPRWFSCDSCDKIFQNAHQMNIHRKNSHFVSTTSSSESQTQIAEKGVFSCKLCSQKFPFQFMLDNHIKNLNSQCNRFVCTICDEVFYSLEAQEEHRGMAHPISSCLSCGLSFSDYVTFRGHCQDCKGAEHSLAHPLKIKPGDKGSMTTDSTVIKIENPLPSQEGDMLQQRIVERAGEEGGIEVDQADKPSSRIRCDLCDQKFSTFSGLWYHKLEMHQEFYPAGFKERLKSRLEKNQQVLCSLPTPAQGEEEKDWASNRFYVVMRPKWCSPRAQVSVALENKKFSFIPVQSNTFGSADKAVSVTDKLSVFNCNPCSLYFQSASGYREHRSKVHNECFESLRYMGAFQCTHCSDTFPCQFMLKEHVKRHTNKKSLPCTLCGLTFHKIQERRQHWKQAHPGVGCPNCGKMYASIKYLQKHISLNCQDHYPASRKFIAFRQRQHNDFHMEEKDKRVEKKIIKCHLCPKICSSVHGWRRHMSENHEDEGFSKLSNTCIICNKVIYGYKALEKHLLEVHAEESGLPIEEENSMVKEALSKSKVRLKDYMKAGKLQTTEFYQDEEGNYHCPHCPKIHSDPKALAVHIKTHINMQLECSVCHKSFKNPTLLKHHVMRHRTTAIYDCETCHKKFMTLQKLNKHNKVHHSKESFVCELCGMSFALNDYLLKHKRCHTDKRPHLCSVCGKTFRTKPELRIHVLIHTQETPYVCEHCGRGFTQKGNWRIHLAQHTGLKPHKCPHCELSFALPSHLKRHLLTHNQKINYRCIWCEKECTQRKHMQMHVARVHKEDFFLHEEQMKLDSPIPIAPSQLKIYNRRLGKAGQVRKAYKTRAKKSASSIQDIIEGNPTFIDDCPEQEVVMPGGVIMKHNMLSQSEESVSSSSVSLSGPDMVAADHSMHILVRGEDHQSYVKQQDVPAGLIEEDGSNVEIIMGENNEINILINNNNSADVTATGISSDLSLPDGLEEDGVQQHVSLGHHLGDEASGGHPLPPALHQVVSALVDADSHDPHDPGDPKEVGGVEVTDAELPLGMEAIMTGDNGVNFTIVYPPPSSS